MKKTAAALLALCLLVTPALAVDSREVDDETLAVKGVNPYCSVIGRVFGRLGKLRDDGASRDYAVHRVNQWTRDLGKTGSHVSTDFSKQVAGAADFVYREKGLYPATLFHYSLRSCELQQAFASDAQRALAGQSLLMDAARACQKKFPDADAGGPIRECLRAESESIRERVRTAKIEMQP